jgi:hypothetical protein
MGDSLDTFFWTDPLLGGLFLRERPFGCLFDLLKVQVEYGSYDVFFRVRGRRGCVGMEETVVGVGGGYGEGVSYFTSRFPSVRSVSK